MPKINSSAPLIKECIVGSVLRLLTDSSLEDISVKDIVAKAGVDRSTYYRYFVSKYDIIECFYESCLDEYLDTVAPDISALDYFTGMFESFLKHKPELMLLDHRGLSSELLDVMNKRFSGTVSRYTSDSRVLYYYYHIGGVFNAFRFWLSTDMRISPPELARQCLEILPEDFRPQLIQN